MTKLLKKIIKKTIPIVRVQDGPIQCTYLRIFGLLVLVRVASVNHYVDNAISLALNNSCDIRNVPTARGKLRRLQLADLKLLKIFDLICRKYDIPYYLCFGTLLGAIRHKGYIPWDDDLDTAVPAFYREKVQLVLEKEFEGTNLMLWGVDKTRWDATLRISHKNFHYLNLDVFYEYSFSLGESDRDKVKAAWAKAHANYTKEYERMVLSENRETIKRFREKTDAYYKELVPEIVDYNSPDARYMSAPLHWPYFRFVPQTAMFPLSKVEFEGEMFSAPYKPEVYLTEHYGDYFSFPSHFNHHQSVFVDFEESALDPIEKELDDMYNRLLKAYKAE